MNIGIDYWQVQSHYPHEMGAIADAMHDAGHEIYIVSAVGKNRIGTIADAVHKEWPNFPVENIYEVIFDSPKQSPELKLAKCKELGVSMFFDDRDDVCRLLRANGIVSMRVTRKDNSTYDLEAEIKS
jgi:acid phosphatase class B